MLTFEQLYKLGENIGVDIFDGLTLPANSPINRTVLINTIMVKCGLNYPVYADPVVMGAAITVWSTKNQYTFEHIAKIMNAQYSPIENKDYTEETTVIRDRDMTDNTSIDNNKSENITNNKSMSGTMQHETTHSGTDTTTDENTTSAYNSSTYEPDNKTTSTLQHGESINDSGSSSGITTDTTATQINSTTSDDKTIAEDETVTTTTHQHGNIGISSNFDLQKSEYTLLKDYNPYNFIAGLFENELTLFVY